MRNIMDTNYDRSRPNGLMLDTIYYRLPAAGQRCRFTGQGREMLLSLITATKRNCYSPPVRSYVLKEHGIWFYNYNDVLRHLKVDMWEVVELEDETE